MTNSTPMQRLLRAGLIVGVSDACFAMISGALMRGTPPARVWQGVASVLLGKQALDGGAMTVVIGLVMHFGVAFAWSALLLLLVERTSFVRSTIHSSNGLLKVAVVYGPVIWLVMSLVVIPTMVHRPTSITAYWFVQLVGHIVFIALPMAWAIRGPRSPS